MDSRESLSQLKALLYHLQVERREIGSRALAPHLKTGTSVVFQVAGSRTLESGKM